MSREIELSSFLSGSNALFLEQAYSSYIKDPASVDPSWVHFFASLGDNVHDVLQEAMGASWSHRVGEKSLAYGRYGEIDSAPTTKKDASETPGQSTIGATGASVTAINQTTLDALRAGMLIRVYRVRGHLNANLDPLGIQNKKLHPELDPASYGFTDKDYDHPIYLGGSLGLEKATLREILKILKTTYCGSIGVEFMHIQDPDQKSWIQMQMENYQNNITKQERIHAFDYLNRAEAFEKFLAVKYPGAKRFGLEGGESLIPAMEVVLEDSAQRGVSEVILGMAHRGRLNVLANIMEKPFKAIFSEFHGNEPTGEAAEQVQGSGDVKYHLGVSSDRIIAGHKVHLSLTANPSHLEAVNPVVVGKVRAKQMRLKDDARAKVVGILIHGDAAFAGQGLVAETLGMSELRGYKVGGTIHIVINNQIGFTTSPHFSRSSPYCSDVVKGIQAPVFHVNGDDVDAVARVSRLASEFRSRFKKDVVLDLYCYRRHGHNEIDEPSFTQPVMYRHIRDHKTTQTLYKNQLITEKALTPETAQDMVDKFHNKLQKAFDASKEFIGKRNDWLEGVWSSMRHSIDLTKPVMTGVETDLLEKVTQALTSYPKTFEIHKRLAKQLDAKAATIQSGEKIDWATGEALAFGTLLLEGYPVRLSGQDVGRGTFSQRHAMMYDQKNAAPYVPLNNIGKGQREIEIVDSPLSEASVLGFEHGYTLADPNILVLWEAQFGDFANGAQMIIDQFISAGEAKWSRMSALVMLLPHGYEGQGPEHSSARLERYLQMCAEDNMFVANCTTPASYYHILRRQMHSETRKPLILMTPKSLLRHKMATSKLADFTGKTHFRAVIPETNSTLKEADITRVVLCSGKVYYDLLTARDLANLKNVALIRLEQLYPFPHDLIVTELKKYAAKADVVWCQEESENMGAWTFVDRLLEGSIVAATMKKTTRPHYVGRPPSASTATGFAKVHAREQEALVKSALGLE